MSIFRQIESVVEREVLLTTVNVNENGDWRDTEKVSWAVIGGLIIASIIGVKGLLWVNWA